MAILIVGAILFLLLSAFGARGLLALVVVVPVGICAVWYLVLVAQAPAEHARIQAVVCGNPSAYNISCETAPPVTAPPTHVYSYNEPACVAYRQRKAAPQQPGVAPGYYPEVVDDILSGLADGCDKAR